MAFNTTVRAILSFLFNVSWAWLTSTITKYVSLSETLLNSKKVKEEQERVVNAMKQTALKAEFQRREVGRLRKEQRSGRDRTSLHQRHVHSNEDAEMG
jgi:hypothetical protein